MKVSKFKDIWYFTRGFFTTETIALYKPIIRQLTIINTRHSPKIINYLEQNLDITEISLLWYKD